MDAIALAQEFALCLTEVLPKGFSATAVEEFVYIETPHGMGGSGWAGAVDQDPNDSALYESAACSVLSGAQDAVSEATGTPWPRAAGARLDLALPGSRVQGNVLLSWFGDESDPILRLRPIVLAQPPG